MDVMQAAQLTGPRSIAVREVPLPQLPDDGGVLLKVGAVGICGSDVHYYLHGRIGNQVVEYPFTIGHECTGTVEMCGPLAGALAPGDRVAVDPAVSCGECDQCRAGRPHTCRSLRFLGCPGQLPGCLSEYIVMPAHNCFKLPDRLSLRQGVLAEPLAIGVYAAGFLEDAKPKAIGILGTGPIGLSVLLAAQAGGVETVYVTDKVEDRLQAALKAGAAWAASPDDTDIVSGILGREQGLDAVFECCGDPEALDQAVEILNPGGTLFILGVPETDRVAFDIHGLRRKEIRIQNIRRQNGCTQKALDLMAGGAIDAAFMATHTFALAETGKALELAAGYADGVIKAVIDLKERGEYF
jgi:L-iditol 2-dehydrogenase